jgi:hypothetical protein
MTRSTSDLGLEALASASALAPLAVLGACVAGIAALGAAMQRPPAGYVQRGLPLYLIWQDWNLGYDTFDSAVVAAPDAETARRIMPCHFEYNRDRHGRYLPGFGPLDGQVQLSSGQVAPLLYWDAEDQDSLDNLRRWADPSEVHVEPLASDSVFTTPKLITASFNAGG